ncbi:MAG: HicA protein [Methylomonas sp.]|nr:MAG: HicA protein [Methylomonas sp.]PPD25638.1 MAG: HicA protein [Methylomonas sp.]PPD36625.1 MAG: HicA protein [Methylomonas sp.]PPD42815.1 MAG: HicA protein [Methylomonas sp.]PPD55991.1 MAG: HicA protein [Methylomonas sp.]
MSQKEKLLAQFTNTPNPKWDDVSSLMKQLGYKQIAGSGSRVKFINPGKNSVITLHKPHPENTIKTYIKKAILNELKRQGLIK